MNPTFAAVTATGATLGGNVTADGGAAVTERGVVYALASANGELVIGGAGVLKVTARAGAGVFSVAVANLANASAYRFRAYAINVAGTSYSSAGTFTTLAAVPTLAVPTAASITATGATLGGNVTADGGAAVTERGVVYSLTRSNPNPAIGGAGVTKLPAGAGAGVFGVNATGLVKASDYTFKAYAINRVGTSYSAAGTFKTLAVVPGGGATTLSLTGKPGDPTREGGTPADDDVAFPSPHGDGLTHLEKHAFGLDPSQPAHGELRISGDRITAPGKPTLAMVSASGAPSLRARFVRRKGHGTGGITYTVQFSQDMALWLAAETEPVAVASDDVFEVVEVAFPSGMEGGVMGFFRVNVARAR